MTQMYTYKLGYYGKLPVSAEFIRCQASGSQLDDLDQWIRAGMYHAKSVLGPSWSTHFAQAGPWRFLYLPREEKQFLTGILTLSHDQAGREFPFLLYLLLDKAEFHYVPWCAPMHFAEFFARSHRLLTDVHDEPNLDRLHFRLQALSPVEDPGSLAPGTRYHAALQTRRMQDHWAETFGDQPDAKYRLIESILSRRPGLGSQTEQGLYRLPLLPAHHEETYDLPLWMDIIASVSGQHTDAAMLIWTRQSGRGSSMLRVSLHPLLPLLWLDLIQSGASQTEQLDIDSRKASLNDFSVELLDNQDMTLETFLRHASSLNVSIGVKQSPHGKSSKTDT